MKLNKGFFSARCLGFNFIRIISKINFVFSKGAEFIYFSEKLLLFRGDGAERVFQFYFQRQVHC